ncbi:nucleotidyl transferase AbiEii/AbiGii toxin family protein [Nonomuraea sp. KM90]|uniref:nucleotidyl transferase AbiEii/AbiGii toxin family protein n=1 Tax=Nonomuraea sp. KM90 TaxID=3457428 RepID=UPI003FCC6327
MARETGLRGSLLLESWVGEEARHPGDLDWIVLPPLSTLRSPQTAQLFKDLAAAVASAPDASDGVRMDVCDIAVDDIWTYERAPGRRLVVTWRAGRLPPGTVQLDFVFNERLPDPSEPALTPRADGGERTRVLGATPELSLAWKLLWLDDDDSYPQGKDRYDAVLQYLPSVSRSRATCGAVSRGSLLAGNAQCTSTPTRSGHCPSAGSSFRPNIRTSRVRSTYG